ncbi:MAG: flagellar protein FliS [candidate division KSB1 bacterium]|nr:flagellar protein FliS [candidate division KSB1 bacterium]MDZ7378967.1 flagellar protein FliS [candidate division KSB1 bacterium]MDZ7385287.1 flagellar protein FliS [candidate division KSB1 bacterium]MDZ7393413.1 flagellar protein FliS [candidate division KSB1 bacterium]MDZ7413741.1 flagellar protein FliS [candidate division KSB1 bacterium]
MNQRRNPLLSYREQEILAAPPEKLVLHLYDFILRCCACQDSGGAARALSVLIDGLNFDYPEIAEGLFRLYDYCLRQVKARRFEETRTIITELRAAWEKATVRPALSPEGAMA